MGSKKIYEKWLRNCANKVSLAIISFLVRTKQDMMSMHVSTLAGDKMEKIFKGFIRQSIDKIGIFGDDKKFAPSSGLSL